MRRLAILGFVPQANMIRIVTLFLGLAIAAAAFYVLSEGEPVENVAAGPPHASIDDESRNRLNRVLLNSELRDADR